MNKNFAKQTLSVATVSSTDKKQSTNKQIEESIDSNTILLIS